jgi:3-oxoacyl-[acyl-carrier protein] reductase
VVVADLDAAAAEGVAEEIRAAGGAALAVPVDIGDEAQTLALAARTVEAFGGIDILINNAAIFASMERHSLLDVPLTYWDRFFSVNLTGALRCTRAVVPHLKARGGGRILNQSSTAAYTSRSYYGIAKAALHSLTLGLAQELGPHQITVNAIAPGPIDTRAMRASTPPALVENVLRQMAIPRIGTVEELARAALFLVSDDAAWITGQVLAVDGGATKRL